MNDEFISELRRTNRLLVLNLTKDMEQIQKIEFLGKAGFSAKEISDLTGIKYPIVNTTLYRQKAKKTKK